MSQTHSAQRYAWTELAKRAGIDGCPPDDWSAGVPLAYGNPEEIAFEKPGIIIEPASKNAFADLAAGVSGSVQWVPTTDLVPNGSSPLAEKSLPILFRTRIRGEVDKGYIKRRADGTIIFSFDIIAATVFMLSRWEEISNGDRDEHGRFPSAASVAFKEGFLDRPIIDEYALLLQSWIRELNPNWEPKPTNFSVKLSHDIDLVTHYTSWRRGLKSLLGDLAARRDLAAAWSTQKRLLTDLCMPGSTSQMRGIQFLSSQSTDAGMSSVFNFMASDYSEFDSGYNPATQAVRTCVNRLSDAGHEIGFHPSYYSFNNLSKLHTEKERLEKALAQEIGHPISGGRQHYLRFQVPDTWRHWAEIGMRYDSTLGYADREGFRCGTCHPFTVFDYSTDRELPLTEVPLIVMESTLRNYRNLGIGEAQQRIIQLARKCKAVGGTFTLLWHNTSLFGEWGERYPQIVSDLAQLSKN